MSELAHRMSELFTAFMPFVIAGLFVLMPRRLAAAYLLADIVIAVWASYRTLQ